MGYYHGGGCVNYENGLKPIRSTTVVGLHTVVTKLLSGSWPTL